MTVLSLFTLADRVESQPPSAWAPDWIHSFEEWQPAGAHSSATNGVWRTHLTDDFHSLADGWKIHISSGVSSSSDVLEIVTDVCREHQVSFKHLRSSAVLAAFNSKWAPRSSSGKFAVLYPHRDLLEELGETLDEKLPKSNGPNILSDFQWSENSSVYVRWGAFKRRTEWTPDGRRILLIEDAKGRREDVRSVPASTASLPAAELGFAEARPRPPMFDLDVAVSGAVQITSAGGVYVGHSGDREVIVKEARQAVDERPGQIPASERLAVEAKTLELLRGVQGIPEKLELKDIGTHRFLVTSRLDGVALRSWVAKHHPALQGKSSAAAFESYLRLCSKIDRGLRGLVEHLHTRGIAHNDLHPGNVLVAGNLKISLIDFEQSKAASSTGRPPNGCPGFLTREGIASDTDKDALDVMYHWMLNPGWGGAVHLDRSCAEKLIAQTRSMYGSPAEGACKAVEGALPRLQLHSVQGAHAGRDWSARRLDDMSRPVPLDASSQRGTLASLGLAVGMGGYLLDATDSDSFDMAVDRWGQTVEGTVSDEPGLWFGWSGVAVCARLTGRKALADTVFSRALDSSAGCTDVSLSTGLAGILAAALVLGRMEAAEELGRRIVSLWPNSSRTRTPGLESGGAGTARVLMNLQRRIGDAGGFQDSARALIAEDRSAVVQQESGAQLRIGKRLLPYLGTGSLGLAVAMSDVGFPSEEWRPLAAVASFPLVLDGGVSEGRMGLVAGLIWLGELTGTSYAAEIRSQRERMGSHLVRTPYGLALAGRGGNRVSGDLLTGTAGFSAVESKLDGNPRRSWHGLSILFGASHSD